MATGWVWAGFFHTRTRPVGQDLWPRPGQFIKRIFFPRAQTRPIGLHGPRWPRPKIINPKICTNLESQIAKYNVIFLAIIQFSWQFSCYSNGCQDLTNQSIQKIQQILETKLANLKIPATKYQSVFRYRRGLKPISLIQSSEILPIELTGTYYVIEDCLVHWFKYSILSQ